MRKHLTSLLFAATIAFATGCTKDNRYADCTTPIMPIHYSGDSTLVHITDYLPFIDQNSKVEISADSHYTATEPKDGTFVLYGDNTLANITFTTCKGRVDVPVLPRLETEQALALTEITEKGEITIEEKGLETGNEKILVYIGNRLLPEDDVEGLDVESWTVILPKDGKGREYMRVYAQFGDVLANDLLIPLQDGKPVTDASQLTRHDDQAQVLYSVLIDRFHNGNTANDSKLNSPEVLDIVDYQGGDIAGITAKIENGFFDSLGVTTIWISPITQNPWDAWGYYPFSQNADGTYNNKYDPSRPYTRFSGYHGYWPLYATAIDRRFGTDDELRTMLTAAHKHNKNVILDYVANHMHINSPTLQAHPDWHTDSILPDGRRNFELWDEARLTTWFDTHIPTLDLEREDVYMPMTDSALYWLQNFDFDGYRHDACKHIPECYWRELTHKAVTRFPDRHIWMIGETYGSPELINTYVKTGMLNAQFDFNVYFTAINALTGRCPMSEIDRVIRESLAAYGSHHTMGNISGNHDQTRIASIMGGAVADGEDAKMAGWTRTVGLGDTDNAYRRALMMQVLNLTIPGVPCIYQGDEYAEAGGNDPDNRHMMRFDSLSEREKAFKQNVETLIRLRRSSMALMYGDYMLNETNADVLDFSRVYAGEEVRVVLSRSGKCAIMKRPFAGFNVHTGDYQTIFETK